MDTPQEAGAHIFVILRGLTDVEREQVLYFLRGHMCFHCGALDPDCRCWDDS